MNNKIDLNCRRFTFNHVADQTKIVYTFITDYFNSRSVITWIDKDGLINANFEDKTQVLKALNSGIYKVLKILD